MTRLRASRQISLALTLSLAVAIPGAAPAQDDATAPPPSAPSAPSADAMPRVEMQEMLDSLCAMVAGSDSLLDREEAEMTAAVADGALDDEARRGLLSERLTIYDQLLAERNRVAAMGDRLADRLADLDIRPPEDCDLTERESGL
jgi:hypothetical protein